MVVEALLEVSTAVLPHTSPGLADELLSVEVCCITSYRVQSTLRVMEVMVM